jgi:hypothetical protein
MLSKTNWFSILVNLKVRKGVGGAAIVYSLKGFLILVLGKCLFKYELAYKIECKKNS